MSLFFSCNAISGDSSSALDKDPDLVLSRGFLLFQEKSMATHGTLLLLQEPKVDTLSMELVGTVGIGRGRHQITRVKGRQTDGAFRGSFLVRVLAGIPLNRL